MVKVERLSENRVKLTVTVSAEQFANALDVAFEKVVKNVKEKGFRPGKFPKRLFLQKYGYESLYEEAINAAFKVTYPQAIAEAKVFPTQAPKFDIVKPEELSHDKPFDYTAEVDVWPEVHLGEYKGLNIKQASTRVTKKDTEAYIEKALASKAENVIKEDAAVLGDTVTLDFEGFVDGKAFEGGKGEKYPLELGSGSFIPGFEDQLVGVKAGDEKDVVVTFPENYQAELSGKEATFKCKIHEVKTKQVPTLNDEFVADLEIKDVTTVEQYQQYAHDEVKKTKEAAAKAEFEKECLDTVLKNSYAEFPASLINDSVNDQVQRVEAQAKQYGIPAESLLQYMGAKSMDDFKTQVEANIRKEYLKELVFDEIIKLENIEASKEEIEAKYLEFAENDKAKLAQLKKQYPESQMAYQVKFEKAFDLIKSSVAPTK